MSTSPQNRDQDRPTRPGEAPASIAEAGIRPGSSCEAADDEPMGGDPPCWAHLFEDDEAPEDR